VLVIQRNLPPSGWVLRYYLKRMHVEESFRDDKSGGFDLHNSHLTDPKRLDTLLLALAVAVLWVYELGEQVLHQERRKEIDPAYQRQLSVFQIGWRHLRRLISCSVPPVCTLCLRPFRPEPSLSSAAHLSPSPACAASSSKIRRSSTAGSVMARPPMWRGCVRGSSQ
jgi:hypothetical protein